MTEFIALHRERLIARTREKVALRRAPLPTDLELTTGVPLFLGQLVEVLKSASSTATKEMASSAAVHGAALLDRGYTIAQVVHDYGDICQAITELAEQLDAPISTDEFQVLNLCLDNAIAEAVTEFARRRDRSLSSGETGRSGAFAHELRNKISAAQIGFLAIRNGRAPGNGSVAAVVTRSLHGMVGLIDRALIEVRIASGSALRERINLGRLVEEADLEGSLEAGLHGVSLSVSPVPGRIEVEADPQILGGAIAGLLQGGFRYTKPGGRVLLSVSVSAGQVEVAIHDECGGLHPDEEAMLSRALQPQEKSDEGLGRGLLVIRDGVEACGGTLRVRDVPGRGCVFSIFLPIWTAEDPAAGAAR